MCRFGWPAALAPNVRRLQLDGVWDCDRSTPWLCNVGPPEGDLRAFLLRYGRQSYEAVNAARTRHAGTWRLPFQLEPGRNRTYRLSLIT